MKTLYFDCFSGISGDMAVAALLDISNAMDYLLENLKTLNIQGYEIEITKVAKNGLSATDFNVKIKDESHQHRGISDITKIIDNSGISKEAKDIAKKIFNLLATAEAKVHNTTPDKIQFHEIGAIDSIIDIVSFAVLLSKINPDKIISSPLYEGRGFINCAHGTIPVPSPATAEIVSISKGILNITDNENEMVTPTGAAIICSVAGSFEDKCSIKISSVGYGAGKKNFEKPNLLRVIYGEIQENETVTVIETNIDDCSPEILSYAQNRIFESGALDVWFEPVFMKKNRPSYKLCVICDKREIDVLSNIIFSETTAIGIRYFDVNRIAMKREQIEVDTKYGNIKVKRCQYNDIIKYYPEYESVKEAAEKNNAPFIDVFEETKRNLK